jgi:small GTP-binding protein
MRQLMPIETRDFFTRSHSYEKVPLFQNLIVPMSESNLVSSQKVKVVFIGDSAVGKTSLFQRFQDKEFCGEVPTTVGGACANVTIDLAPNPPINLIVWDTAGQEKYRGIVPMYFSRAVFILIVYDVTNRASFDSVPSWASLSQEKAPTNVRLVLIGNKSDLEEQRVVSWTEGTELATSIRAIFLETSALNSNGVRDLIVAVASQVCEEDFEAQFFTNEKTIEHKDEVTDTGCC